MAKSCMAHCRSVANASGLRKATAHGSRFTLKWSDPKTDDTGTRAGMQVYRIEASKLAEICLRMLQPGSAWADAVTQEHWTRPPPIK